MFNYDENTHTYTLNGKKIGGVTEIISPLTEYSKIPKVILENKRNLGTQFHIAIKLYAKNDLDEELFPIDFPELIKPMNAFKEWYSKLIVPVLYVEQPFCNEKLKYAGCPDMVTETCIYDFKLRPYNAVLDPLQLSAYEHLVSDCPPKKKIVVSFDLEGNCKPKEVDNKQAWSVFRKCIENYYETKKFDELIEKWRKSI